MPPLNLPEIKSISVIMFETRWASSFHKTPAYELLHVLDGRFELTYEDGRRFPGAKGDTFLVRPNTPHEDIFEFRKDLKILVIHFSWQDREELLNKIDNARINRISSNIRSELRWTFEHMRNDLADGELERTLDNARLMTALLLIDKGLTLLQTPAAGLASTHELVLAAQDYVKRNYGTHLTLDGIAAHLKVSPYYLSRLFKQECCFNLFEYIAEVRIDEAKKLLRDGQFLVSEVASRTGFENPNYFAKIFRKKAGCPPAKFR